MVDVSIILVNYNTKKLLIECINSIYNKTNNLVYEIIVVDNNSHDGTEEAIKEAFSNITFIQSGDNIGFGRANNLGIKQSRGDFVFLLNSDTILINNAISILFDFIKNNHRVGICGGNLYDRNERPTISFVRLMPSIYSDIDSFFGGFFTRMLFGENIFFNHTKKTLKINGYVSGADMMIRKSVLEEVGLFDPDFFMYYEETELTWRIRNKGYDVVSISDAKIIHLEGASETIKEHTLRRMIKSKYLYFEKIKKTHHARLSFLIFILTAWSRIFIFKILNKNKSVNNWLMLLKLNKIEYVVWSDSNTNK